MYKIAISRIDESEYVIRISDGASIPIDDANIDYQAFLAWLADGHKPLAPEDASD